MYEKKGIVYSDAGKYLLSSNGSIGFQFEGKSTDFEEKDVSLDDMTILSGIILFSKMGLAQAIIPNGKYGDYKASFVKKRYSNDDQIAIILNKDNSDEDLLMYTKMQEWRSWSSEVSKKIVDLLNKQ